MLKLGNLISLSATDLVGYLSCRHLTHLERAVAAGTLKRSTAWDPLLLLLWERGARFEKEYRDHLEASGLSVRMIDGVGVEDEAVAATLEAMREGIGVIVQGALAVGRWRGRADILRRVETPSNFGPWSYEALDTKLARETKGGTVLQLCSYSELLAGTQGMLPEFAYVVAPWSGFEPQTYRVADYAAYFRWVKRALEAALATDAGAEPYPDPVEHCDVCNWQPRCAERRRSDDHLCLVANLSKLQRNELGTHGISTLEQLAMMPLPLSWKPERGAPRSYERVREQARVQLAGRRAGQLVYEMLPISPDCGLPKLPEPSLGDVFLDLEGDPFVGGGGFEYLFGYAFRDETGEERYEGEWAFEAAGKQRAFERLIDFLVERLDRWPDLHVFHYAHYEPAALRRLMGRYATREEQLDRLLRAQVFVDLYAIVRHSVRVSVETYSIKKLESLYGYERAVELWRANHALARLEAYIELGGDVVEQDDRLAVQGYNQDDCVSTWRLRDWLEDRRAELAASGVSVPRPAAASGEVSEQIAEWLRKIEPVMGRLLDGIPADATERTAEQHGRWLLANMLDWHRRELKASWWEFFRLRDLIADDLLEERAALSGLMFRGVIGGTTRAPAHRYAFPPQETEIRGGEDVYSRGGAKLGSVHAVSPEELWVDVKKRMDSKDAHPEAIFAHKVVRTDVLAESLLRLGAHVVEHGLEGDGAYHASRDLLLRAPPRLGGEPLRNGDELVLDAACRLAVSIAEGVLPIQGPPGTGKTFTGARMICELVRVGQTVGITANSHKVIRNLLDGVLEAAADCGLSFGCVQKVDEPGEPRRGLQFTKDNAEIFASLGPDCPVGGGTAWLWSRPEAFETVDVLFVDEAAQMSLANVLAVSQAAKAVVLLGDPRQLEQPIQGSHPEGTDVSALHHLLGDRKTVPDDRGLFLGETWRLNPDICQFTSELFYEGRLVPRPGLEHQILRSDGPVSGAGLRFLSIPHEGNQSSSPEEADSVAALVHKILASSSTWIDAAGSVQELGGSRRHCQRRL